MRPQPRRAVTLELSLTRRLRPGCTLLLRPARQRGGCELLLGSTDGTVYSLLLTNAHHHSRPPALSLTLTPLHEWSVAFPLRSLFLQPRSRGGAAAAGSESEEQAIEMELCCCVQNRTVSPKRLVPADERRLDALRHYALERSLGTLCSSRPPHSARRDGARTAGSESMHRRPRLPRAVGRASRRAAWWRFR